MVGLFLNSLD